MEYAIATNKLLEIKQFFLRGAIVEFQHQSVHGVAEVADLGAVLCQPLKEVWVPYRRQVIDLARELPNCVLNVLYIRQALLDQL